MRNLGDILEGLFDKDVDSDIKVNVFTALKKKIGKLIERYTDYVHGDGYISVFMYALDKAYVEQIIQFMTGNEWSNQGFERISNPYKQDINNWYVWFIPINGGRYHISLVKPIEKIKSKIYNLSEMTIPKSIDRIKILPKRSFNLKEINPDIKIFKMPEYLYSDLNDIIDKYSA